MFSIARRVGSTAFCALAQLGNLCKLLISVQRRHTIVGGTVGADHGIAWEHQHVCACLTVTALQQQRYVSSSQLQSHAVQSLNPQKENQVIQSNICNK